MPRRVAPRSGRFRACVWGLVLKNVGLGAHGATRPHAWRPRPASREPCATLCAAVLRGLKVSCESGFGKDCLCTASGGPWRSGSCLRSLGSCPSKFGEVGCTRKALLAPLGGSSIREFVWLRKRDQRKRPGQRSHGSKWVRCAHQMHVLDEFAARALICSVRRSRGPPPADFTPESMCRWDVWWWPAITADFSASCVKLVLRTQKFFELGPFA